ncbi:MAG: hydantoinase/oxoprolinase family protein [Planctomycetes bacterium]|nr:hydantoinase/oxoprolinase family protein [Planctomycetota bacterium]
MGVRIGVDTGGTFTDVVRWSPRGVVVHKVPSTPADPGLAVLQGIAAVRRRPDEVVDVVHGTTVGLNAVLTGRLAKTAFVTNRGFVDLIEIGRQERTDLYALEPTRPVPPVPRELRVEVDCRRGPDGAVVRPLSAGAIQQVLQRLRRLRPEALAIGLLHSPADPSDELALAAACAWAFPELPITTSAALLPAFGEYERFSAAILNAATMRLVGDYTRRLVTAVQPGDLRLMRSSLGIMPATEAARFPARAMFSGPAGGVLATASLAARAGLGGAVAFDMGGTSTDVCLVHGDDLWTDAGRIGGLPLPVPSVDVHTVGCGGGSIAFRDRGGALCVGPQSAGAMPGPACYGHGDQPTVTDAHMALGHLGATTLLGGAFPVDVDASVRAIERLARQLRIPARRCAEGILTIAETHMARALMVVTVERAVDPNSLTLVAYGGAGGLHAHGLCRRLGMRQALVPPQPGAFSALGLALAGESQERLAACHLLADANGERRVRRLALRMSQDAIAALPSGRRAISHVELLVRYAGQGAGLRLLLPRGPIGNAFARLHQQRFGFAADNTGIEVVQIAVRAAHPTRRPPAADAVRGLARPVAHRKPPLGGPAIAVYRREDMTRTKPLVGPAACEEISGTTWIPAGASATLSPHGIVLNAS